MLHLHESFNGFWFDENGNGIKLCLSQPLDSIARHIQDAVLPLERRQSGSDLPTQSTPCGKQLAHTDVLEKGGATEMKPSLEIQASSQWPHIPACPGHDSSNAKGLNLCLDM